jgi:hypothetical protein
VDDSREDWLKLYRAITLSLTPTLTPTLTLDLVEELEGFELLTKVTLCAT